jgi:hypothetical protein
MRLILVSIVMLTCILHPYPHLLPYPSPLGSDNISPYTGREAASTTYGYILTLIMGSVYNWVFVILINLVLQAIISGGDWDRDRGLREIIVYHILLLLLLLSLLFSLLK